MLRVGFTAIRQGVRAAKYRSGVVRIAVALNTEQFLERVIDRTRVYPPVPAGSTYQRTYELDRSWEVVDKSHGLGIAYAIENRARDPYGRSYAGLVHGPEGQWGVHASHGWRNIGDVMERMGGRGQFKRQTQEIITRLMGAV